VSAAEVCSITGHRIPRLLASTLARPVHPVALDEPAILARLDAIAARVGHSAVAMVTLRSRGFTGGAACASLHPNGVGRNGATFAFADDMGEALDALAAALRDGVA
jgi:hypothetical protein